MILLCASSLAWWIAIVNNGVDYVDLHFRIEEYYVYPNISLFDNNTTTNATGHFSFSVFASSSLFYVTLIDFLLVIVISIVLLSSWIFPKLDEVNYIIGLSAANFTMNALHILNESGLYTERGSGITIVVFISVSFLYFFENTYSIVIMICLWVVSSLTLVIYELINIRKVYENLVSYNSSFEDYLAKLLYTYIGLIIASGALIAIDIGRRVEDKYFKNVQKEHKKVIKKFEVIEDDLDIIVEEYLAQEGCVVRFTFDRSLFTINYSDLKHKKKIGNEKDLVEWKNQLAVFKSCNLKEQHSVNVKEILTNFEKLVRTLISLKHRYLLEIYGCVVAYPKLGILQKYCPHGNIMDYLIKINQEKGGSKYKMAFIEKIRILFEISQCMSYLHDKKVLYRNLQIKNVLIDENISVRLSNLRWSRVFDGAEINKELTKRVGGNYYISPECYKGGDYSWKSDVFSFAILAYVILTERFLPYGKRGAGVDANVANDPTYRPIIVDEEIHNNQKIKSMLIKCWDVDPKNRLTFDCIEMELKKISQEREEKKISLIIGNCNYEKMSKLENVKNDTKEMEKTLKELGFDVSVCFDCDSDDMHEELFQFILKRNELLRAYKYNDCLSLIFYAGHGVVQPNLQSFFLPIDFSKDIKKLKKLSKHSLSLKKIIMSLESGVRREHAKTTNIVILDCCRTEVSFPKPKKKKKSKKKKKKKKTTPTTTLVDMTNNGSGVDYNSLPRTRLNVPFRPPMARFSSSPLIRFCPPDAPMLQKGSVLRGVKVECESPSVSSEISSSNVLICYSTNPKSPALDSIDGSKLSPYCSSLCKRMKESGKNFENILKSVKNDVLRITNNAQNPWYESNLTDPIMWNVKKVHESEVKSDSTMEENCRTVVNIEELVERKIKKSKDNIDSDEEFHVIDI